MIARQPTNSHTSTPAVRRHALAGNLPAAVRDREKENDMTTYTYEPECGESDDGVHDWSREGEGGCDENPGVWATGGTTIVTKSHCTICGLRRTATDLGPQRNPCECDTVEYIEPEEWPREIGTRVGEAIAQAVLAEDMPREWTGLDIQDGDQLMGANIHGDDRAWEIAEAAARDAYEVMIAAAE